MLRIIFLISTIFTALAAFSQEDTPMAFSQKENPMAFGQEEVSAHERLQGVVVDEETGDSIPLVTLTYGKGDDVFISDAQGCFNIPRHNDAHLTFTAVGYKPLRILIGENTPAEMRITLKADSKHLRQVEVRTKRQKYSRKDNPAVELMKRVVAKNKEQSLKNSVDYYKYTNYQKLTLALNNMNPMELEREQNLQQRQWYINQLTFCDENGKLILPFTMEETVSEQYYRRSTNTERTLVLGKKTEGLTKMVETGQVVNKVAQELFTDIDIHQNQIRFLHSSFTSPIGNGAVAFYRYYIVDTLMVGNDRCIQLEFLPNNQQDFGFRGNLYVLADSSLHVRRCELTIPKKSDVNWVDNIHINLEYERENGRWLQTKDDLFCELSVGSLISSLVVFRTTRRTDYYFYPLPGQWFEGMAKERNDEGYDERGETFWTRYRTAELTPAERNMDRFLSGLRSTAGFGWIMAVFKIVAENFIELGSKDKPAKVALGPINTLLSSNFYDGMRTRLSLMTTAALSPHWFFKGYVARGWKSKGNYYNADVIYSLNKKKHLPNEFPKRTVTFTSSYDNMSPSDRFSTHDKDNIFTLLKWNKDEKRMFYNRQILDFDYEVQGGLEYKLALRKEKQTGIGDLEFPDLRISEAKFGLRFAPGESFVSTKQSRVRTNRNNPVFNISHAIGFDGVLGSDCPYNLTEVSFYDLFWLNSWGKLTLYLKGSAQWNKVPYMLLSMPPTNTSYIAQNHTFNLLRDMEFLNDRYAMLDLSWDMSGKILNRLPLVHRLKWREYIGFLCLWGTTTEKNRQSVDTWPAGSRLLDGSKPYMELVLGVHNVMKFFHIQYVRRLNYNDIPGTTKNGVRLKFEITF